MAKSGKSHSALIVVDEYFPQTSAPSVRLRSFIAAGGAWKIWVVGGCERNCDDTGLVEVTRPDERKTISFIMFLIRMNIAAVWQTIRRRPRVVIVSIPKYELLFVFPFLRLLTRVLVLDVRDSIDFINYSAYFAHVMPKGLAKVVGGVIGAFMRGWFWLCTKISSVVTVANPGIAKKIKGSVVVANGVNTDLFSLYSKQKAGTGKVSIMYVGNFAEKDRFDVLINALEGNVGLATVHLAGKGRNKHKVLAALKSAKIDVIDHGVVSHENLPKMMSQMDVGFLFRDEDVSESIPVSFYEFISVGVPVISNPVGLMSKFVNEHKVGWVVHSPEELIEAIRDCRSWMRQRSRLHSLAVKNFSRKIQAQKFWKIIGRRS